MREPLSVECSTILVVPYPAKILIPEDASRDRFAESDGEAFLDKIGQGVTVFTICSGRLFDSRWNTQPTFLPLHASLNSPNENSWRFILQFCQQTFVGGSVARAESLNEWDDPYAAPESLRFVSD